MNMKNMLKDRFGSELRWISWRLGTTRQGKITKIPVALSGGFASSTNEKTWSTYREIKAKI